MLVQSFRSDNDTICNEYKILYVFFFSTKFGFSFDIHREDSPTRRNRNKIRKNIMAS